MWCGDAVLGGRVWCGDVVCDAVLNKGVWCGDAVLGCRDGRVCRRRDMISFGLLGMFTQISIIFRSFT